MQTKYLVALVSVTLAVLNALQTALASNGLDQAEVAQLVVIAAGALGTFFVPLVTGPWAGAFKTGLSIVAAIGTALAPLLLTGMITPEQWITVVIAAVNALAVEIGVQVRVDAAATAVRTIENAAETSAPLALPSVQKAIETVTADPRAAKIGAGQDVADLLRLVAA